MGIRFRWPIVKTESKKKSEADKILDDMHEFLNSADYIEMMEKWAKATEPLIRLAGIDFKPHSGRLVDVIPEPKAIASEGKLSKSVLSDMAVGAIVEALVLLTERVKETEDKIEYLMNKFDKPEEKPQEEKKESPYVIVDGKREMADGSGMVKESGVENG